jgi:hypothetical protein
VTEATTMTAAATPPTKEQKLEAQLQADAVLFGKIAGQVTVDISDPVNLFNISGDLTLFNEIVQGYADIKATIADL